MRSLISTIGIPVEGELLRRVMIIDSEDYDGVRRKVREHFADLGREVSEEEVEAGVLALKQYYAVALMDPANAHAVSRPLDPYWHAHILHSEQYMSFCEGVVGEYMHHQPLDHTVEADVSRVRRLYDYTLEVMPKIFTFMDDRFWPTRVLDADLICFHKGNADIYTDVQSLRLFEPCPAGAMA